MVVGVQVVSEPEVVSRSPRASAFVQGPLLAQGSCTETGAAKISDFLPVAGVAEPQLSTGLHGDTAEIPKVSPGHTAGSPNAVETCAGADNQPLVIENARRYCAYPCELPGDSHPT